jgi:hypothetical protein
VYKASIDSEVYGGNRRREAEREGRRREAGLGRGDFSSILHGN